LSLSLHKKHNPKVVIDYGALNEANL